MARNPARSTKRRRAASAGEWVGGLALMPAYITGEGEPFRPEALLWLDADGLVVGSVVDKPGRLLEAAGVSLTRAMEEPMAGPPRTPDSVRVASPDLAEAIRESHPGIDVVCAPTPELDELLEVMRRDIGPAPESDQSYLGPGVSANAVASLFRATAALYRAAPWKVVPDDETLFSITIEQLGLRDAVASVIGQLGENFGVVLFSSLADFWVYVDAADDPSGLALRPPRHFVVSFEGAKELPAELIKEIGRHKWELAGPNAYPLLYVVDEDLLTRPATAREVAIAEAIALAMAEALRDTKALRRAFNGGEAYSRTFPVTTSGGQVEVVLGTPVDGFAHLSDASDNVLVRMRELGRRRGEIDTDELEILEDELLSRFTASPEATAVDDGYECRLLMELSVVYFGETIATLRPAQLRDIVFEIIPRKVSVDPSQARPYIEQYRAFYTFLKRVYDFAAADACLRILGGDAVARLESALADSSRFGMAKSLLMAGREAGFDTSTPEGLEAWLEASQEMPLPPSVNLPVTDTPRPARSKSNGAKKEKRKAARRARQKNR